VAAFRLGAGFGLLFLLQGWQSSPAKAGAKGGSEISSRKELPTRVNEQIRIPQLRVVDEEGEQLGILDRNEALDIARERGLDLVEVAPNARPPVCRIMDYGKFKYEESKKAKRAKQKQTQQRVKTVKFRPKTEEHDYAFKKKHIMEFLDEGSKVKVVVMFRGREMAYVELGERIIQRLLEDLKDVALLDDDPKLEGRNLTLMVSPRKPAQ
jgi:translation initiation factor IF-3